MEAALAKAEELGGSRVMGPDEVPGAGIVLGQLTDPEGHMIGVIQDTGGPGARAGHIRLRIAHRSGNAGEKRVVRR